MLLVTAPSLQVHTHFNGHWPVAVVNDDLALEGAEIVPDLAPSHLVGDGILKTTQVRSRS